MNSKAIILSALVLACVAASAQNFNPSVEVTNAYEGKPVDARKQDLAMNIPDSLLVFDYDFDYSVFDNPYKGSYEFSPYLINMKPEPVPYAGRNFYLRAGAGYSLHPELALMYSPTATGKWKLDVYDGFQGYLGSYRRIKGFEFSAREGYLVDNYDKSTFSGHDLENNFGLNLRGDFRRSVLTANVNYKLLTVADTMVTHLYNEASARVHYALKPGQRAGLTLEGVAEGKIGGDNMTYMRSGYALSNKEVNARVLAGVEVMPNTRFLVEAGTEVGIYSRIIVTSVLDVWGTPKLAWSYGPVSASAGVKFAHIFAWDPHTRSLVQQHQKKSALFYPDAHLNIRILKQGLTLYADVTGGNDINTFSSLLSKNHFFNQVYQLSYCWAPTMDNSVTRYKGTAGLRGQVAGAVQYNLYASYAYVENNLLEGLFKTNRATVNPVPLAAAFCYQDMKMLTAGADLLWKSDRLSAAGRFQYLKADYMGSGYVTSNDINYVPLPEFTAEGNITYNWAERLYFGVSADFASERNGYFVIPMYCDLGVQAEFRFDRRTSFWAKGGNLLNQTIQKSLTRAENGMYFTAGICLIF